MSETQLNTASPEPRGEPMAMPEPEGFRARYRSEPGMTGHFPWVYADLSRRGADRRECEYENLYTADQMKEYAKELITALQEIADMCCAPPNYSDQTIREIALNAYS